MAAERLELLDQQVALLRAIRDSMLAQAAAGPRDGASAPGWGTLRVAEPPLSGDGQALASHRGA